MNPLARICLQSNCKVSGSDKNEINNIKELSALGANLWISHNVEKLKQIELPDVCVISTAIEKNNPELIYLQSQNVKIWHRSDLLQCIANNFKYQIVISGTHGKTTTTALTAWLFENLGLNPSWLIGGEIKGLDSSALKKNSEIFIFEGDESDQSFLKTNPSHGIITYIEPDHLENYENSFDIQISKFKEFAKKANFLLYNGNCPNVKKIVNDLKHNNSFDYMQNADELIKNIEIPNLKGKHNCYNALIGITLAESFGANKHNCLNILKDFNGVKRRFEHIFTSSKNIKIYDDYGHHPTEIEVAINCAKDLLKKENSNGRLVVLFQPHLPTRLRDLWENFKNCFKGADILYIADLYLARGQHLENINSMRLVNEMNHEKPEERVEYCGNDFSEIVKTILQSLKQNDLLLILGAGDITKIGKLFKENLSLNTITIG